MSGREVREYTNLSDPKDRKFGKGKDKIDDEDITFQRMVAKVRPNRLTAAAALPFCCAVYICMFILGFSGLNLDMLNYVASFLLGV